MKGRHKESHEKWAVPEYQLQHFREENPGKELYWAFLRYDTILPIKDIPEGRGTIEDHVSEREAWVVPWDFMGGREFSEAEHFNYHYPKVPELEGLSLKEHKTEGGKLYVAENSPLVERVERDPLEYPKESSGQGEFFI